MLPGRDERGLTLVEALVATGVVVALGIGLHSAGYAILNSSRQADAHTQATELGVSLLEEITSLPFEDPQTPGGGLGPEVGEWGPPTSRQLFDDVDDYAVWTGSQPLQTKGGTAIDMPPFRRAVSISFVGGGGPLVPTAYKQIVVTVTDGSGTVASVETMRVKGGRGVDG